MNWRKLSKGVVSLTIIVLLMLNATPAFKIPVVESLERIASDIRLRATLPGDIDDRIVIADIDEASLQALGRWPWDRGRITDLVETLIDHYQVNVIGFDVLFAEADDGAGLQLLRTLDQSALAELDEYQRLAGNLRSEFSFDQRFASSMADRNIVLGFIFEQWTDKTVNQIGAPVADIDDELVDKLSLFKPQGYVANLPEFQASGVKAGFFDNPDFDADGQVRKSPVLQIYNNGLYPSLALAVTRAAIGDAQIAFNVVDNNDGYTSIESLQVGSLLVPLDEKGSVTIPYRGYQGSFPYYSISDILNKEIAAEDLEGRIVLVGATAPGILDLRATPLSNTYPGVEVHANIISAMLDNRIPMHPAWVMALEMILLLLLGAMVLLIPRWLNPVGIVFFLVLVSGLVIAGNFWSWNQGLILPLASPLLMILAMFLVHMTWGFLLEHRHKKSITRLFGQYVPPDLVDEMASQPDQISLDGQAREMTVLFSDVRGFTSISEGLEPKELTTLMNELLTPMTRVIHQNRGTIDKYMGDAIMAFWGAPLPHMDHAHAAILTARSIIQGLGDMNREFASRGWPPIKLGVGLNTGIMNVGNMGSEFRMAYTVLGDAVNLGARLEGLTKNYGVSIIVSETTRAAAPDYTYLELDRVRVKGRDESVAIYEPLDLCTALNDAENEFMCQFHKALALYWARQWDEAEAMLRRLAENAAKPDSADWHQHLYEMYLHRIQNYRASPPGPEWDGVFTHQSK
ncbi:MAG: adenylate/guanylate cyclase domain-containing protein [Gammaproteobacteria bacterium]|nr:adenylate/guanylate cyclase domain-containing protein [Gammaproteobacteria bacterium]NNF67893.1 adenylate/guanylate cyclase domain-containing protein [Gammaproteobacteria bacterium]